jgi:MFS family permease
MANTMDPVDYSEKEKDMGEGSSNHMRESMVSSSSHDGHEDDADVIHEIEDGERDTSTTEEFRCRASTEVKRVASNAVSRIASRLSTRSWPDPPPAPDGGVKAWTQVVMGWLVIFTTWGMVNSFGVFQTYYTTTLPYPASAVSWIGSVQVFLTFLLGAFSGRLLDAGWFLPTFIVGVIIQLLGIFLMSISTQYWQLMLTQGFLMGIGGGIFFTPAVALVATYFDKRRGVAVGLATTGNAAGGMIYPIMTRELLPRLGFAWTARVLGFFNLACLLLVLAFMRPRLPPRKSGPFIDLTAFLEPVFVAFVGGVFALTFSMYYTFYYVSMLLSLCLSVSYAYLC